MLNEYKLRTLILQLGLAVLAIGGYAQNDLEYKGWVKHENSAVSGAEVLDAKTNELLTTTDSTGYFNFKHTSSLVVIVHQAYYRVAIELKETESTIQMTPKIQMLDQIVVSEGKTEKQVKRTTISLELIQPDLIDQTAPLNVVQSINRINGVQIVDNQANIRAGSGWSYGAGSRVQVLVNGLPILSGDASQPQWSFIPTEGIENVEIIKGAASVIYGSSALNGVINIKTKTHGTKPFSQVSLSTGFYDLPPKKGLEFAGDKRYNLSNVSAFHLGKLGKWDLSLGMNMLYDQGYKMSDNDQRGRLSLGFRKTDAKRKMVYGLNASSQMGRSSSFLLWDSYERGYNSLDSGITQSNTQRLSLDPYWYWNNGKYTHEVNSRYLHVSNDVDNGDTSNDQSNYSDLVYVEYQLKRSFARETMDLITGIVGQSAQTRSPLFSGTQNTKNLAGFAQLEKRWRRLIINAGVRYEYFKLNEREEAKPVIRSGLNYELAKATFLRASYGQGYRFPSIAESFVATTVGPVTIYPNADLQSETGQNIELGIKQGYEFKGLIGFVDLALFEMSFDKMSEFLFAQWSAPDILNGDFGIGFKAINAGQTRVRGFEASIVVKGQTKIGEFNGFFGYNLTEAVALNPEDSITVDFNGTTLTYQNTSTTTSGELLKYRPRNSFKGDLIWSNGRWSAGYGFSLQSEVGSIDTSFVSLPITLFVPGVDSAMSDGITAYSLHNMRLGYQLRKELKLNIIVDNIWNTLYMIRPADLGAPRSFRFQISYTFN